MERLLGARHFPRVRARARTHTRVSEVGGGNTSQRGGEIRQELTKTMAYDGSPGVWRTLPRCRGDRGRWRSKEDMDRCQVQKPGAPPVTQKRSVDAVRHITGSFLSYGAKGHRE